MSMEEKDLEQQEKEPVQYATPMQRLWAWVGVVYMVLLVLLSTYGLAHGSFLRGIGGLMVAPALCGLGASAVLRYRQGKGRGGLVPCILIAGAAFLLALMGLIQAVPNLVEQL